MLDIRPGFTTNLEFAPVVANSDIDIETDGEFVDSFHAVFEEVANADGDRFGTLDQDRIVDLQ